MGISSDVTNQLARINADLVTAQNRIDVLEIKETAMTITPAEQIELDDLRDNVKPDLLAKISSLTNIQSLLPSNLGRGYSLEGIVDTPATFFNDMSMRASIFIPSPCVSNVLDPSTIKDFNDVLDSLIGLKNIIFDNALVDVLVDLVAWENDLTNVNNVTAPLMSSIDLFETKLYEFASANKILEFGGDPCLDALSDKLQNFKTQAEKDFISDMKNSASEQARAVVRKNYLDGLKV